ncbi:MAG: DUF59 domain-containing protein [Anaerolineae bacterium]|nr:DUF59 domain-containing protein [Anaerolineae bacterium]
MGDNVPALSKEERRQIWAALKGVNDPEIPLSIVDLGMVRKIEDVDGEVHVTMVLTSPICPMAGIILEQARQAAQAATERTVKVIRSVEPWDPSMMAQTGEE